MPSDKHWPRPGWPTGPVPVPAPFRGSAGPRYQSGWAARTSCGGEAQELVRAASASERHPPGGQAARRVVPTPTPTITAGGNHASLRKPPLATP